MKIFDKEKHFFILNFPDDLNDYRELLIDYKINYFYLNFQYIESVRFAEQCPFEIAVYRDRKNLLIWPYVKRKINDLPFAHELKSDYWDIFSPFELVSLYIERINDNERGRVLSDFFAKFNGYCNAVNIVCEFLRLDPFLSDYSVLKPFYELEFVCNNIFIDLNKNLEEIQKYFHHSVRKNIAKAESLGLRFFHAEKNKVNIDIFVELYHSVMKRRRASDYYFFSAKYFSKLISCNEDVDLFTVVDNNDEAVASSIMLHHNNIGYHHLTGHDEDIVKLRVNDFMINSLVLWAKKQRLGYLYLGGGSESIRRFKAKFSRTTIPYYVGKKIHNNEQYKSLCKLWQDFEIRENTKDFFPLYRAIN